MIIGNRKIPKCPLDKWVKTTLWLRVVDGPSIEFSVYHPSDISNAERTALLAKHASQQVKILWQLRDNTPDEAIIQGQYAEGMTKKEKALIADWYISGIEFGSSDDVKTLCSENSLECSYPETPEQEIQLMEIIYGATIWDKIEKKHQASA